SVVDFPQPDGPTSDTNSPSATASVTSRTPATPPRYTLLTRSSVTVAMRPSLLHRARREARDDASLEEDREHHQRQRGQDRGGGNLRPGLGVLPREEADGHRDGALRGRGDECQGVEELVPREDEDEDGSGGHPRCDQRQQHAPEGLEGCAAVHAGGPVE